MACQRTTALRAGGLMAFALMVLASEFFSSGIPMIFSLGVIRHSLKGADDGQFREMA
jgi:hypothetical protein